MIFTWPKEKIGSENSRNAMRQLILESITIAKSGHPGGSLSLVEIFAAIFDGNFEHNKNDLQWPERDRVVLSKGHGVPALYAALSQQGYFSPNEMAKLRTYGHFLQGHPDRDKFKLMEASTGSLGQGFSVALGIALGLRLSFKQGSIKRLPRVYCVLGDGEMQEGQIWECLMAAAKYTPGNLIAILDYNKAQIDGYVKDVMNLEPLKAKIESFGWYCEQINGHDFEMLKNKFASLEVVAEGMPKFFIADTIKGKGVTFMENMVKWHGVAPKPEELEAALNEIWGKGKRPYGSILRNLG